jgi:hypothetical protein
MPFGKVNTLPYWSFALIFLDTLSLFFWKMRKNNPWERKLFVYTYAVSSGNTGVFWLARNKSCVRFSERNTSEWTDVGFSAVV